jgi:hypothetical protein
VLSEHTGVPELLITTDSLLYRQLSAPGAPAWARLIAANFDAWFTRRPHGSWLHDPLTFSAALAASFVTFRAEQLHIAPDARLYRDLYGRTLYVSSDVDYMAAITWMIDTLRT